MCRNIIMLIPYILDLTLHYTLDCPQIKLRLHRIMSDCITTLTSWFLSNDMLPNPSKTEVMFTGTRQQLYKVNSKAAVSVCSANLLPVDNVKIVGVVIDNHLSFDKHVSDVCSSANYHIRALSHISPSLTQDMAATLACSIVASRLDYCNSVLNGVSNANIAKLQVVQNNLARAVCRARRRSSSSALLSKLHWLPIAQRIQYKTSVLTL